MEKIDLKRVKNLSDVLDGKQPPLESAKVRRLAQFRGMGGITDPLSLNIVICSYRGKYHKFVSEDHEKLSEKEVIDLLDAIREKDRKLYYICTEKEMSCPIPQAFLGKHAENMILKDVQEVIDFIASETNVRLKKSDL